MSVHYLIDPFTNAGDIIDVVTSESGETDCTGATVIRVPDGVAIHDNPSNLADLLTAKYDGLLASYAGFTEIVADSCMSALTVDPVQSKGVCLSEGFVNHSMKGTFVTFLTSVPIVLPFAPTQCVVTWEIYTYSDTNDKTGRFQRVYTEIDPDSVSGIEISFNGGGTFNSTTDSTVLNIPVPDQGASLVLSLGGNPGSQRLYVGSWSVIF